MILITVDIYYQVSQKNHDVSLSLETATDIITEWLNVGRVHTPHAEDG